MTERTPARTNEEEKQGMTPGQRFNRRVQAQWRQQQLHKAEMANVGERGSDARRHRDIEEYWTNAVSVQARSPDFATQAQQPKVAADINVANQSRSWRERLEQLSHMTIAHATDEHMGRTREQCTPELGITSHDRVPLPHAMQAHTPVFLHPTHGLNELELLLLERRHRPVPLVVAIRTVPGSGLPANLVNSLSIAAFAVCLADRTMAVCLSIDPDPGYELLSVIYSHYEVAFYAANRLDPILQGAIELVPYGGWDNFHRMLEQKARTMDTFICRRAKPPMSPNEMPRKHIICATSQLLYHEFHEHRMIPLAAAIRNSLHPATQLSCSKCAGQDVNQAGVGQFACPDCAFVLCGSCINRGSGVIACTHTKRLHVNINLTFHTGTARLQESCEPQLDQVAQLLHEYRLPICVEGYANYVRPDGTIADDNTQNRGEENCTLLELARRRAVKIIDGLTARGVPRSLLVPKAAGRANLITRDPKHIADNMRAELYLNSSAASFDFVATF